MRRGVITAVIYRVARLLVKIYLLIFNSWVIEGAENVPASGPAVLAANHISVWDPIVMGCSVKRTLHYMAKEELFKLPILKWLLPRLECFPVKRGKADRNAMRLAAACLEKGEILGLFPEGSRSKTGEIQAFLPGTALFALRSKAPIVPVALMGTKSAFPSSIRGKFRVKIGQPLCFPELYEGKIGEKELEEVTAKVRENILKLMS